MQWVEALATEPGDALGLRQAGLADLHSSRHALQFFVFLTKLGSTLFDTKFKLFIQELKRNLRLFLFLNILHDCNKIIMGSVSLAKKHHAKIDPHHMASFVKIAHFKRIRQPLAFKQLDIQRLPMRQIFREGDVARGQPFDLVLTVADDVGNLAIYSQLRAIHTDMGNAYCCLLKSRSKTRFGVAQFFICDAA